MRVLLVRFVCVDISTIRRLIHKLYVYLVITVVEYVLVLLRPSAWLVQLMQIVNLFQPLKNVNV